MAAKVLVSLALIAAVAYAVDDCKCNPPTELENSLLWEFFKNISSEREQPDNERLDAVLPGELSPLIDCNCFEKTETRRKRKIQPEVTEEPQDTEVPEEPQDTQEYSDESIEGRRSPKCPHGFVWFAIRCVDERFVMEKK